jgi:Subtilase family
MKKLITFVVTALLVGVYGMVVAPAGTADTPPVIPPSVAIIDSGINTALFAGSVVDEVCILEWSLCPNGKNVMDGVGAANTGVQTALALTHGNEMASIITKVNPAIKIIPIRIVGITDKGNPYIYSNNAVKQGLDWVVANRVKYNIQAVNVSQGKIFPGCTLPAGTQADIDALRAANVAVIAATGNDSNRTAVMSIACAPGVIAIGATDNPDPGTSGKSYNPNAKPYIARYSNGNAATDFYLNGRWYALQPNGKQKFTVGTSIATGAFTGWYTLNYKESIAATYQYLVGTATVASNEWLSGKYLFVPSNLLG